MKSTEDVTRAGRRLAAGWMKERIKTLDEVAEVMAETLSDSPEGRLMKATLKGMRERAEAAMHEFNRD